MNKRDVIKRFMAFLLCATVALTFMPTLTPTFADETSDEVTATVQQTDEKPSGEETKPKVEEETKKTEEAPAAVEKVEKETVEPDAASKEAAEAAPESESPNEESQVSEDGSEVEVQESEEGLVVNEGEGDEAEKEQEDALNKEEITFTGSANSVNVSVTAQPGTFPAGTKMSVTAVSTASVEDAAQAAIGGETSVIKAVDISFSCDGKEIEPAKSVSVTLSSAAFGSGEALNIVHVKDNGSAEKIAANLSGNSASFKSDEFSVYLAAQAANDVKVNVKVHVYAWDENGEYYEAYTATKSNLASGVASWYMPSYMDNKVTNTTVEKDGKNYKFSSGWLYEDGSRVPETKADGTGSGLYYVVSYEDAVAKAVDGIAEYSIYAEYRPDVLVTLNFNDIRHNTGDITSATTSNTLSPGNGWNFSKKKMEQATGLSVGTVISYMGYEYTYTGEWKDDNGNIIDASAAISIKNADGTTEGNNYYLDEDTVLNFSPIYTAEKINGFDYKYVDKISTGSGSWSNADAFDYKSKFGELKHTYSDPSVKTPVEHYMFEYWQLDKYEYTYADGSTGSNTQRIGDKFTAGQSDTFSLVSGDSHGMIKETEVVVNAYWQPSVTVRYHYNGNVVEVVKFADIETYPDAESKFAEEGIGYSADGNTLTIDGEEYAGWYADEDGNTLADAKYDLPEITKEKVDRTVYDVYAVKQITVKAADNTWVYDGTEHSDNGATVTAGKLIGSDVIEAENTGRITDKGTVDNEIGEIKITRDGEDVTKAYKIAFEKGTLEVTPAPLTITTQSATKRYDGTALTRPQGTINGLVNDESATATGTGSQTAVGSSRNGYRISWDTAKEENYEIVSVDLGTLTVTAVPGGGDDDGDNPGGGNNPGGGGPGGFVPAAGGTAPTIAENPVPRTAPTTNIPDPAPPLAEGVWALVNLIAAILTTLGAIIALFRRKEEEDEEAEENMDKVEAEDEEEEDDDRSKKMLIAKIAGALAGIAAPITFILTEDMSLPMVMIDKWTVLMLIILAVQVVAAIFNKKASELDDEEEEEAEAPAY